MIIQARQAFKCQNAKLGTLELRYQEIRSGVDEAWKEDEFFKALLKDGLVIFFSDTADKTIEAKVKETAGKKEEKIKDTELQRLLDEAKAKAITEAGVIAKSQGYDKIKADEVQKELIEKACNQVKQDYAKTQKQEK